MADEVVYVDHCSECALFHDDPDEGPMCIWLGEEIKSPWLRPTVHPECPLLKGDIIIKRKT